MRFGLGKSDKVIKILLSVVAVIAAWGVLIYFARPLIFGSGYAVGVDVRGHMFTSQYIADYLKAHHTLPAINPYWYAGFEIFHNTLWLAYVPVVAIYLVVGNAPLASRLFPVAMMLVYALTMFVVIRHSGGGAFNGFVGAVAFSLTPVIVENFGSQTKAVAIAFIPLAYYFTRRLLTNQGRYNVLWLSLISALMLFAHPMIGLVTMGSLLVYALIYAIMDRAVSINRAVAVGATFILAGLLLSWYLIPSFFEHLSQAVAMENILQNSMSLRRLFYQFGVNEAGLVFLVLAGVTVLRRRNPEAIALFAAGLIGLLLALGSYGPFYRVLPLPVYPYLWLVFSIFAFIFLTARIADAREIITMKSRDKILLIGLVLLILPVIAYGVYAPTRYVTSKKRLGAYAPMPGLAAVPASTPTTDRMLATLKTLKNPGRIYTTEETNTDYILMGISATHTPNVEGAYYLASSLGRELAWIKDATKYRYPMYAVKRFSHMNIRYLLVSNSLPKTFLAHMKRDGFKKIEEFNYLNQVLYYKDSDSSYLIPIRERTLVLGKAATELAGIRPDSVMGLDPLDSYDAATLKFFDTIVLTDFAVKDKTAAEKLISDYVNDGGTVVVDLQGMTQNMIEENPSFLGVTSYATTKKGTIALENRTPVANTMPEEITPPASQKQWHFVTYYGLDQTLSKLKGGDRTEDVLGYKRIGKGRVLFVGLNLFHYAYLTHDQRIFKTLDTLVPPEPVGAPPQIGLSRTAFEPENGLVRFEYSARADVPLLVSLAYSPHWHASLDGKRIEVNNLEDMILLTLPKGQHTVEIRYGTTPIHYYGAALSLLTAMIVGFVTYRERKRAIVS